ncbi:MAG: hypothetical protein ACRDTG_32245 [Pseudonocardiaceae bacterium]
MQEIVGTGPHEVVSELLAGSDGQRLGPDPPRGELEQACEVGRTALEQLPHVHSPRCLARLHRLAKDLRARKANIHVRDFSAELDRRLQLTA